MTSQEQSASYLQQHDDHPVHLCGVIQPHGVLLALHPSDWTIQRVSQNIAFLFDREPADLLGQPLATLLQNEQVAQLQQTDALQGHVSFRLEGIAQPVTVDCLLHQTDQEIVVELEPRAIQSMGPSAEQHMQLGNAIARLHQINDFETFLHSAAAEMAQMTGFDHVMVYQFDEQRAGQVVAEVAKPGVASYLGLWFPATDIPRQVRALYQRGIHRFSPDLNAPSVRIVAGDEPTEPLDLSLSVLRGIDPCCISYYQNINVSAFLVVALIKDQQLWGLMTCHNTAPKPLPYWVRSDCSALGQFVAAELGNKITREELGYVTQLSATLSDFIASITHAKNLKQALITPQERLLSMVSAQGAAVYFEGEITLLGQTPSLEQVEALVQWSSTAVDTNLFQTQMLSRSFPPAAEYPEVASGLLLLKISQVRRYFILWFRPEVLQNITWAGAPADNLQRTSDGELILCPRASFEAWQETVQATSLPWRQAELDIALDLRGAIVGIVLNRADELAKINIELERSNQELASFAYAASHDLKEPLRGIHNFSNLLLRRYGDVLDESGINRLNTLVRLAQRMDQLIESLLQLARLGQAELTLAPTDLNVLVQKTLEVLRASRGDAIANAHIQTHKLPTFECDAALMSEVFMNLLSNALKYTEQDHPKIEIGSLSAAEVDLPDDVSATTQPVLYVRDNGIGIKERHLQNIFRLFKRLHERDAYGGGAGAGLTITKKIIERHQGHIWVTSTPGKGTTFYFVLT